MSNKELTTAFLTYMTLGGYLRSDQNIAADFEEEKVETIKDALSDLLQNLIAEVGAMDELHDFDLCHAKELIQSSYEDCVSEREKLEAAQAGEDVLGAFSAAAGVAAAVFSWTGVGLIVTGVLSVASEAASVGMEFEVQNLERSLVTRISNMGSKIAKDPAFRQLTKYHTAADRIAIDIAKLDLGGNKAVVHQALLGLARVSKSEDGLRKNLIHFFETAEGVDDLAGKYRLLAEAVLGGQFEDARLVLAELEALGIGEKVLGIVVMAATASGLYPQWKQWSSGKAAEEMWENGLMSPFSEEWDEYLGMSERIGRYARATRAIAVVGAVAETALLGLQVAEQRKRIDELNGYMDEQRDSLLRYYEKAHEAFWTWGSGGPDAILYSPDKGGKFYTFKGDEYVRNRLREAPDDDTPTKIVDGGHGRPYWGGWPASWGRGDVDAAVYYPETNKYYLFKGDEYSRSDLGRAPDDGYPKKIVGGWSGWPPSWGAGDLDAVVYSPDNERFYLFKGDEYVSHHYDAGPPSGAPYEIRRGSKDQEFHWTGWPSSWGSGGLDAAVYSPQNELFYLFKGDEYCSHHFNGTPLHEPAKIRSSPGATWYWSGWPSPPK